MSGAFGSVDAGAVNYNTLGTYLTGQPFGTAIGSGFRTLFVNDAQSASQVRSDNSIKYVSPSFSGFTGSLYYAGKQTKAVDTSDTATAMAVKQTSFGGLGAYDMQGTTELGLNYADGPIAASFSSLKQDFNKVGTGSTEQTINTLGGNYKIGDAKLFGLYQTNKTNTDSVNNKAYSISGTYPVGAVVLMAQAGRLKNTVTDKTSKIWGLGADYNLSKRTAVYFRAESIDDKAGSVQAAMTPATIKGATSTFARTAIGLRHAF